MYEYKNGSKRIVNALYNRKEDKTAVQYLAHILNYDKEQLVDDIQAVYDFLNSTEQE